MRQSDPQAAPAGPAADSDVEGRLTVFARFHARPGREAELEAAIRDVTGPTGEEPGNISIRAFRSLRDPALFFIHSIWRDEAAFELHADLPHTVRFLERIWPLIDHELDVARTIAIG